MPYVVSQLLAALLGRASGAWAERRRERRRDGKHVEDARSGVPVHFRVGLCRAERGHGAGHRANSFYELAIGFTVAAGAFAVGGVSGGAFNPVVAFGASILGIFKWSHIWIYIIANLLGGAAAAYAFLYVQPAEESSGDIEAARTSD